MTFVKGGTPWNKGKAGTYHTNYCYWAGKKLSKEHVKKISDWHKKNKMFWKGDDVGYHGVHKWIQKELGKASKCELCDGSRSKNYQWSNKDHKYKRDVNDYWQLCSSCHKIYDIYKFDMKYKSGARSEKLLSTLKTSVYRSNVEYRNSNL